MSGVRLGIDVGSTNTDAVAVDTGGAVLAGHKTATTAGVLDGIRVAMAVVLADVGPRDIDRVMLGTTYPADAIVRRADLSRVGVLRIAAPATLSVPPLTGWPKDLAARVCGRIEIVRGGHEYDGTQIEPLDEDAVVRFARECDGRVDAIAVTGVSAPANPDHEKRAAGIIAEVLGGDFPVTLGHEVGNLGLLERENSAVLNAALTFVGRQVVHGLRSALEQLGSQPEIYVTQNDGTLLSAAEAMRRPILTIGSGPTNSMRGAAHLSGLADAIVMDVGGTSTQVGLLVGGFPRESALPVEIGGVRTNYRMPDLITFDTGGGTVVRTEPFGVGPDSVGPAFRRRALSFGGDVPTLGDVCVLAGRAGFADPAPAARVLANGIVRRALDRVDETIRMAADRIKAVRGELPLVAVGGGAYLVPDSIPGISEVLRHENAGTANAIGAAVAEASGSVDRIFRYDQSSREACLREARSLATDAAIRAGADPAAVRLGGLTETPMSYMPGNGVRVQVKAVGPLHHP